MVWPSPMLQSRKKTINISDGHKSWIHDGAIRGMALKTAKAARVDGNQVVASDRKPQAVTEARSTYL
jgi:hypothetical protein